MGKIYIGTSGDSYKHWKEIFYPKGLAQAKWLPFHAEHFNTVEINAAFYRHFGKHVFEKWNALIPEGFNFTIKGRFQERKSAACVGLFRAFHKT